MDCGVQCAVTHGQLWMQMWHADNLGTLALVRVIKSCNPNKLFMLQHSFSAYVHADATAFSNANFGQGTVPILLDDVACTATQSRLVDCSYDSNTADCSHSHDAGVRCVSRELHSHRHLDIHSLLTTVLSALYRVYSWHHQTEEWFHKYGG